jgi:hypothetical protein
MSFLPRKPKAMAALEALSVNADEHIDEMLKLYIKKQEDAINAPSDSDSDLEDFVSPNYRLSIGEQTKTRIQRNGMCGECTDAALEFMRNKGIDLSKVHKIQVTWTPLASGTGTNTHFYLQEGDTIADFTYKQCLYTIIAPNGRRKVDTTDEQMTIVDELPNIFIGTRAELIASMQIALAKMGIKDKEKIANALDFWDATAKCKDCKFDKDNNFANQLENIQLQFADKSMQNQNNQNDHHMNISYSQVQNQNHSGQLASVAQSKPPSQPSDQDVQQDKDKGKHKAPSPFHNSNDDNGGD